eukprot:COSAG01_NODE_1032_length_12010_cov_10.208494_5_plen_232_part_00
MEHHHAATAGLGLCELDDLTLTLVLQRLPLASVAALCCVCRGWRRSLDARDSMWAALQAVFEQRDAGGGTSAGQQRASHPPARRQSKRVRQSGKQQLVRCIRARARRSDELVIALNSQLQAGTLTVSQLRSEVLARAPVNINRADPSGFTPLHLVVREPVSMHSATAQACGVQARAHQWLSSSSGVVVLGVVCVCLSVCPSWRTPPAAGARWQRSCWPRRAPRRTCATWMG